MAAGCGHSVALKDDGTVVAWGSSTYDLNTVRDATPVTAGTPRFIRLKVEQVAAE